MEAELSEHLGYERGQAPPGGAGNARNGTTPKTLQTDQGPVRIETPRDRRGSFEPQIVPKRKTRFAGFDEKSIALYARGMSVRDIQAQLGELYGVEVGRDLISRLTDAVVEEVRAWQQRPLEDVYPVLFLDCLVIKVREGGTVQRRACYLALGVTLEGDRDVLGMWFQEAEGAKFWLQVLNELKQRGVQDVLIACVDGLKGFPDAIEAVFPDTWVQTSIVHLIRHSLRYVPRREREQVARDLRPIHTATDADAAREALEQFDERWGERSPPDPSQPVLIPRGGGGGGRSWQMNWWIWPLPPAGPLALVCEWPAQGIELTRHELDATQLLEAARRVEPLWPDGDPSGGSGWSGSTVQFFSSQAPRSDQPPPESPARAD